jgi:hypothetical protein
LLRDVFSRRNSSFRPGSILPRREPSFSWANPSRALPASILGGNEMAASNRFPPRRPWVGARKAAVHRFVQSGRVGGVGGVSEPVVAFGAGRGRTGRNKPGRLAALGPVERAGTAGTGQNRLER